MPSLFASGAAVAAGKIRLLITAIGPTACPRATPLIENSGLPLSLTVLRPWASLRGATGNGALEPGWSMLIEAQVDPRIRRLTLSLTLPGTSLKPFVGVFRQLPARIPGPDEAPFQVLLLSCYCRGEDAHFLVSEKAREIQKTFGIDLTVMMGDQVYLDIPTFQNLPESPVALADALEKKYRDNFVPNGTTNAGFASILSLAPTMAIPDDHEYWNNAPHLSPLVQNSFTSAGRSTLHRIASALFTGYQGFAAPTASVDQPFEHAVLDIGPLSFFLANTRSFRTENRNQCISAETINLLDRWTTQLQNDGRFGALITGQSMLDAEAQGLSGAVGDYALSNYQDFPRMVRAIERLNASVDVLLLTGDEHWGRVARLFPKDDLRGETSIYEVICSPSALITTVVGDFFRSFFRRLSGTRDPWPRHNDCPFIAGQLRLKGARSTYWGETLHRQKGDMLCLLSISTRGQALHIAPRYFSIGRQGFDAVTPFLLKRRSSP